MNEHSQHPFSFSKSPPNPNIHRMPPFRLIPSFGACPLANNTKKSIHPPIIGPSTTLIAFLCRPFRVEGGQGREGQQVQQPKAHLRARPAAPSGKESTAAAQSALQGRRQCAFERINHQKEVIVVFSVLLCSLTSSSSMLPLASSAHFAGSHPTHTVEEHKEGQNKDLGIILASPIISMIHPDQKNAQKSQKGTRGRKEEEDGRHDLTRKTDQDDNDERRKGCANYGHT